MRVDRTLAVRQLLESERLTHLGLQVIAGILPLGRLHHTDSLGSDAGGEQRFADVEHCRILTSSRCLRRPSNGLEPYDV